jgi:glycosyltransferase involved in cell wall biosynthesis
MVRNTQEVNPEPVTIVTWKKLGTARLNLGWKIVQEQNLKVIKLYEGNWWKIANSVLKQHKDAVHIFFGFWSVYAFFLLIIDALLRGRKVAIINEPYSITASGYINNGNLILNFIKVKLRPLLYKLARNLLYFISPKNKPCIIPLSLIAKDQFIRAGFKPESLFPFGYFVEKQGFGFTTTHNCVVPVKIIFVGNIIQRKGIDILISAIKKVNQEKESIILDIYGGGQVNTYIPKNLNYIHYKGVLPQSNVQQTIAKYDFLALPSRHDGWGLVVNEALLQGIPVIISDRVGAKCLIENSGAGIIFKNEDVDDLTQKIWGFVDNPISIDEMKRNAIDTSTKILPINAAKYLVEVLDFYFTKKCVGKIPYDIWCGKDSKS